MKRNILYIVMAVAASFSAKAQVKIGNNPTTINASSLLELESTNKGLLLPRLALVATNSFTPLQAHVVGMMVYNTATAGTGSTAVVPGYYYNNGTLWLKVGSGVTKANNGLSLNGDTVQLGGVLTKSTMVSGLTNSREMRFTGTGVNAFNIDDSTFTVDFTNNRVGINQSNPAYAFDVRNDIRIFSNRINFTSARLLLEGGQVDGGAQGNGIYILDGKPNGNRRQWYVGKPYGLDAFTIQSMLSNSFNSGGADANGAGGTGTVVTSHFHIDAQNNRVGIGTTAPAFKLEVNGTTACTGNIWTSDQRKKQNIKSLNTNALKIIKKINPVTYEWKQVLDDGMKGTQIGFIAQELEEVLPSIVVTANNEERSKGVKYNELLPIIIKAMQEQQDLIEVMMAEIKELNATK